MTTGDLPPSRADILFVFAGAPWRKTAGLAAWRSGAARVLVLSVGRFEWRRLPSLGVPVERSGLIALVEATPPPRRHFFLLFEGERIEARLVPRGQLGTWSEARALASLARETGASDLLVCTSGYHMPRALRAVRRALGAEARAGGRPPRARALPVPEPPGTPLAEPGWRRSPRAWLDLAREGLKRLGYLLVARATGA